MRQATLDFLHGKFAPGLANIAPTFDEHDQDALQEYFRVGPNNEKIKKLSKRLRKGPPLSDTEDKFKKHKGEDPDMVEWHPEGEHTFATMVAKDSKHHKMFTQMGFSKTGGAKEDGEHYKHTYSIGPEMNTKAAIGNVVHHLESRGYKLEPWDGYAEKEKNTMRVLKNGKHKVAMFSDIFSNPGDKVPATLVHYQPKEVAKDKSEASTDLENAYKAANKKASLLKKRIERDTLKNMKKFHGTDKRPDGEAGERFDRYYNERFAMHPQHDDYVNAVFERAKHKVALNRSKAKAEARVMGVHEYDWYTWTADRAKNITDAKGKHNARLTKGARFGLRAANSDKNKVRMITDDHGPTIVYSLTHEQAETLKKNAKKTRVTTKAEASTTEQFAVEAAPKKYAATIDSIRECFKKCGLVLLKSDIMRVTTSVKNAGTLITITSKNPNVSIKRLNKLRICLMDQFKNPDMKISLGGPTNKPYTQYFITVKPPSRDKMKNKVAPGKVSKPVKEEKKKIKKSKTEKHFKGHKPTKFKMGKKLKFKTKAEAAYARMSIYAQKTLGSFTTDAG